MKFRVGIMCLVLFMLGCSSNQEILNEAISTAINEHEKCEDYYIDSDFIDESIELLASKGVGIDEAIKKGVKIEVSPIICTENQSTQSFDKLIAQCPDGYVAITGAGKVEIIHGAVTKLSLGVHRENESSWYVSFSTPADATIDACVSVMCLGLVN